MDAGASLTAGIVVLTIVTIETGGVLMLRIVRGQKRANVLQSTFFRAGHAHAGVLVILGLVMLLLSQAAGVGEPWAGVGPTGVLVSAILMPAGFFLSVLGTDPQRPGRAIALVWLGAGVLAVGLIATGIGLISAAASAAA
ncbi:hypothetical protein NQ166_03680 [Microbacterium sp. zg.Y1090]|uniref:hypothetical protein n=1 Tax=Microbacterium wangruii TaxID=3049073 RepID=UPI00214B6BA7|nr:MULTISPECIES: hypothetical protein [unclassified Microbacterium]MCR2817929.1 hypothetical protein [Microbacterium sp. zg.Y1090]WIM27906.1 hypothetical protein QNO26_12235 [Microbacterium sp. zg-Y1090]